MGRRPGKTETRKEIIKAARSLFMERGYQGTSVRAIAAAAAVDASMVYHYFADKEALFQAATQLPASPMAKLVEALIAPTFEELPHRIVTVFLAVWEEPISGPAMIGVLRRVLADPDQLNLIRGFMTEEIWTPAIRLIATRHPTDAHLRVTAIASYLFGTVTARHILKIEPLASLPTEQLAPLMESTIAAILNGQSPATSSS